MEILGGGAESLIIISPKTRQKCNKENRKSLVIKNFRFLLRDSPMLGFAPGGRTSRTSAGHHRRLKQGDLCEAEIVFCALPVLSKASF